MNVFLPSAFIRHGVNNLRLPFFHLGRHGAADRGCQGRQASSFEGERTEVSHSKLVVEEHWISEGHEF